jgi:alpha-L-rhamnosidase
MTLARWPNEGDWEKIAGFPEKVSEVPKDVFATAFFAHSAQNVAKMARVLGRSQEAEQYEGLFAAIRTAFQKAYVDAEGRIKGDTQAGYALALHFELLDEAMQAKAVTHLLTAIERYKGHASTGIQSSHRMLLELSARGHHDEAYRLATLRSAPSWGYSIDQGATTIWERWDGYVEGRGFQVPTMNSFNHYALGSVGEWMWRELAGIQPDETQPGYKHFVVRPRPAGDLLWVKARYESIRGPIECHWDITDEVMTLTVTVPANTTATIHIPTTNPERVTESGKLIGRTVHEVGSGRYRYVAPYRAGNSGHTNTKGDGVRQK